MQPILHETTDTTGIVMQWIPLVWGTIFVRIAWSRLFGHKPSTTEATEHLENAASTQTRREAELWTTAADLYVLPGVEGRGSTWR